MRVLGSFVLAVSLLGGCVADSGTDPETQHGYPGTNSECLRYNGACIPDLFGTPSDAQPEATPYCGDGHVDPGEECDDGNEVETDGCSTSCVADVPPTQDACDLNNDGDRVDEGECDYVPPPSGDACDLNNDGDRVDEGECDYVPPPPSNPCDLNNDGDTTDHGECDHVCHDGE